MDSGVFSSCLKLQLLLHIRQLPAAGLCILKCSSMETLVYME